MLIDEYDVEASWYLLPVKAYEQNPSLKDGLIFEEICQKRHDSCRFITQICDHLKFPLRTMATCKLYFHLFFAENSMKKYPPLDIAFTSVLVACKAEETYIKIRQILIAAFQILNPSMSVDEVDAKTLEDYRKRVVQYEDKLLDAIRFNFSVTHAYQVLLKLGHSLGSSENTMRSAFRILHEMYATSLVLHYPPHYLALTAIIESKTGQSVERELSWSKEHQVNKVDLSEIQERYIKFYSCIKT